MAKSILVTSDDHLVCIPVTSIACVIEGENETGARILFINGKEPMAESGKLLLTEVATFENVWTIHQMMER